MYPNQPPQSPQQGPPQWQPQPQQQLPTDYLNQIAPQAPKRSPFTFGIRQAVFIGIALVILMIILVAVVNSIGGGKKDLLEHLSARLTATETVATNAQANLKSSQLRSLNSNLKIYLTNTNRDIVAPLTDAGINVTKLNKKIVTDEATTALDGRLEDARLNAVFDRTYAREMAYQLGNTMTLMNQIYSSTKNEKLKTFLESAYNNLKPTQESFANYTSSD